MNSAREFLEKGNALYKLNKYEDAITCFESAIAIKPNYSDAFFKIGLSLAKLNKNDDAVIFFYRSLKMASSNFSSFYLNAGIQQAKKGMVEFRVEKGALVHAGVGKLSFSNEDLTKNIKALYDAIVAAKPSESKGIFMQKMYISSSQGPSVPVDVTSVIAA